MAEGPKVPGCDCMVSQYGSPLVRNPGWFMFVKNLRIYLITVVNQFYALKASFNNC